ncbi:hypothetical protein VTK26DRAFT_7034 [Humicola hyalothermophila]
MSTTCELLYFIVCQTDDSRARTLEGPGLCPHTPLVSVHPKQLPAAAILERQANHTFYFSVGDIGPSSCKARQEGKAYTTLGLSRALARNVDWRDGLRSISPTPSLRPLPVLSSSLAHPGKRNVLIQTLRRLAT